MKVHQNRRRAVVSKLLNLDFCPLNLPNEPKVRINNGVNTESIELTLHIEFLFLPHRGVASKLLNSDFCHLNLSDEPNVSSNFEVY